MHLWSLAVVAAVVVMAGGTVAYAACGGGGGGNGCDAPGHQADGKCQQNPDLVWENPSGDAPSVPSVSCSLTLTSSTLSISASNLAPGENCTYHAVLANIGTGAASLGQTISSNNPASCPKFSLTDNLPAHPPALAAHGTFNVHGALSLSPTATNVCHGAKASFQITITGTGQSQCDAVPGPAVPLVTTPDWGC